MCQVHAFQVDLVFVLSFFGPGEEGRFRRGALIWKLFWGMIKMMTSPLLVSYRKWETCRKKWSSWNLTNFQLASAERDSHQGFQRTWGWGARFLTMSNWSVQENEGRWTGEFRKLKGCAKMGVRFWSTVSNEGCCKSDAIHLHAFLQRDA